MLSRLEFTLEKPENNFDLNCSSLFQGVLMEALDTGYASTLHGSGLNPYSQYIIILSDRIIWSISALNNDAYHNILLPVNQRLSDSITLEHKKATLNILDRRLKTLPYKELMDSTFFGQCSPQISIKFVTPTAFKVNGAYQIYPTVSHVFGSLMRKYDQASTDSKMFSEEVLTQIDENVRIAKYNLRSTLFHLEGVWIPSFTGTLTFKAGGPKQLTNLLNLLIRFGEYSGVGIKTSIGMGAIEVQ